MTGLSIDVPKSVASPTKNSTGWSTATQAATYPNLASVKADGHLKISFTDTVEMVRDSPYKYRHWPLTDLTAEDCTVSVKPPCCLRVGANCN